MDIREVILVTFTILAQMSVGAFLVLGVVKFFVARKAGAAEADRMGDLSLIAIIAVLGLGLLASIFHLGNPLAAPRAINDLGSSWLSREILSGSIFFVLGALYALLQLFKWGPAALRTVISWLAALAGITLIFCMSMVYYILPTQPAWNNLATPISFFTTTLLLGALAMGVAFVANYSYIKRKTPDCADLQCTLLRNTLSGIAVFSVFLLGVEFVVTPVYLVSLATGVPQAIASAKLIAGPLGLLFLMRMILAFVGAGVFGFFLYQNAKSAGREKIMGYMAYTAFTLVLIAEVLGRMVFYSSHVGITLL